MERKKWCTEFEPNEPDVPKVPQKVFEDAEKSFANLLLFRKKSPRSQFKDVFCSACMKRYTVGEWREIMENEEVELMHAQHKESYICPRCKAEGKAVNVKIANAGNYNAQRCIAVFLPVNENDVWVRCYFISRSYTESPMGCTTIEEVGRYHFEPGKCDMYKWFYDNKLQRSPNIEEPFCWNHGVYCEKYEYTAVLGTTAGIEDTFLKYSGYEQAAQLFYNVPMMKWLGYYCRYPAIEMLAKMGHHDVLQELIFGNCDNKSIIDWKAKRIWNFYGLEKGEYDLWYDKFNMDMTVLKLFHRIKGEGSAGMETAQTIAKDFCSGYGYYSTYGRWLKEAYHMIALCRKMRTKPGDVVRYVHRVHKESGGGCHLCPGITVKDAWTLWLDYIDMADAAGKIKTISPMPKDLKAEHDKLLKSKRRMENMRREKDRIKQIEKMREDAQKAAEGYGKKYRRIPEIYDEIRETYAYTGDQYSVVVPQGLADLLFESDFLTLCIARKDERYFGRILSRESYLMFLRRNNKPDVPWYLLEVEPGGVIRQKRTHEDDQKEDLQDALPFLAEWQSVVQSRVKGAEKKRAQRSEELRKMEYAELREAKTLVHNGMLRGKMLADVLEADLLTVGFMDNQKNKQTKQKDKVTA